MAAAAAAQPLSTSAPSQSPPAPAPVPSSSPALPLPVPAGPAAAATTAAAAAAAATATATASTATTATTTTATTSTTASSSGAPLAPNKSPVTLYSAPPKPYRPDHLATIDLIIVVIYLCLLLSTSISTMIRTRKSNKRKAALASSRGQTAVGTNNFLAGRKMSWFTVALSIFASNLGSEHFIGLSGSAAANGISVAAFEMNALIILQVATWIFLPVLIVSKISTLPEYMSKRFGGKRIRTYLAVLSILLYIFTKISVNLYSGGIFLQQALGWNLYSSAMFILALTSVMTLTGGLKGAMVVDNLQAIVMTVGASIVATRALVAIGGWEGLKQRYSVAVPSKVPANLTHCAQPNPRAFQMLRPSDDKDMPWIGFIIGQTPASLWYWSADQMMVQRFLSARSLAHVQGSAVFAGYLKILPLLFMVVPGMISRCLFTDEVGCIDPIECQRYCQSSVSCSNTAYPRLVLELMPIGARGMMVAAMVAALMGDLCNVFNSASALFSCDVWPLFRKHATQKEQETVGRVFVIVLVLASIMWIPVIQEMQGGQLFIYIQAVAAMFAPPIAGVYVCAVLWRRTNEIGAFWSMMIGFALGVTRMAMSFMYKEPSCGQHVDERPWILKHVHYMYYAAFLFWVTIACTLLISKLTKPPAPFRLIRTTFWTRFDTNIRRDDKNVFEMKYSGATTNSTSQLIESAANKQSVNGQTVLRKQTSEDHSISTQSVSSRGSAQRLFTIEEHERKTADLSSVVVDISKAAASGESLVSPSTAPASAATIRRPILQHQTSLSASASAAVGAASEAGKFLANKFATEVNLKGAKEMVMAAANHLTSGGVPSSRIKFKNLPERDEDDDDDDDDHDDDDDADDNDEDDARKRPVQDDDDDAEDDDEGDGGDDDGDDTGLAPESTMDDDEDEDSDFARKQRLKQRNKKGQSVLSAAISSYKQKQRKGYKQALADEFDDDEDDEDEDEDEDDDEMKNLNRSASFKGKPKSSGGAQLKGKAKSKSQNKDKKRKKKATGGGGGDQAQQRKQQAASAAAAAAAATAHEATVSSSTDDRQTPNVKLLDSKRSSATGARRQSKGRRSQRRRPAAAAAAANGGGGGDRKISGPYEEEEDLESSGRTFRCLDNSVSLLIKNTFEETLLRIAVGGIILVAFGIFILFSLPPAPPPKQVVDILIKN